MDKTTDMTVTGIEGCARCGGDHGALVAHLFERPYGAPDGFVAHYWATCPTTGDPVFIMVQDSPHIGAEREVEGA